MSKPIPLQAPRASVQRKVNQPAIRRTTPVAPPVYRPQPLPKVLQRKTITTQPQPRLQTSSTGNERRTPVAPPVYRPQTKTPRLVPAQKTQTPAAQMKTRPHIQAIRPAQHQPPKANIAARNARQQTNVLQRTPLRTASSGGVIQRLIIDDMRVSTDETWDEILPLIEESGIPAKHHAWMKAQLRAMPARRRFNYYEDVAEELEKRLCRKHQKPYPWKERVAESPSASSGSGWFGSFMKGLTYYLAASYIVSNILPANAQHVERFHVEDVEDDDFGVARVRGEIECAPSVSYFCEGARDNPLYREVMDVAREECGPGLSITEGPGEGACRFTPWRPPILGGVLSCNPREATPTGLPKVAHELEHSIDFCRENIGGVVGRTWIRSEINALTVQAAAAGVARARGDAVDARDTRLLNDYRGGCPVGGELYGYLVAYHLAYEGRDVDNAFITATWGGEIGNAVNRFRRMTADVRYEDAEWA